MLEQLDRRLNNRGQVWHFNFRQPQARLLASDAAHTIGTVGDEDAADELRGLLGRAQQ